MPLSTADDERREDQREECIELHDEHEHEHERDATTTQRRGIAGELVS
jgi:hypothetical protein